MNSEVGSGSNNAGAKGKENSKDSLFSQFSEWLEQQQFFVFSGCVEEKYPAIKEGLMRIGKTLGHGMHKYPEQSCCSGPLTKMGLGNDCTLNEYTQANIDLRSHDEQVVVTSCNGCYSYMIKTDVLRTDIDVVSEKGPKPVLLHSIEYLSAYIDRLVPIIKYPIKDLIFVTQYGCHYLNQYRVANEKSFRNAYAEHNNIKGWTYNSLPTYLQDILIPLGAKFKEYTEDTLCCGGSTPQRQINLHNALSVAEKKFDSIHRPKPDAIVTICPLCMYWMEDAQLTEQLTSKYDEPVPIIHINELLSLMLGHDDMIEKIIESHKIDPKPILQKIVGRDLDEF